MICDQDPLRRRPGKSTARRKREDKCVRMARKNDRMAFQARADVQNQAIGWLRKGCRSLGGGTVVRFPRIWMVSGECRLKEHSEDLLESARQHAANVTIPGNIKKRIAARLRKAPSVPWDAALHDIVEDEYGSGP